MNEAVGTRTPIAARKASSNAAQATATDCRIAAERIWRNQVPQSLQNTIIPQEIPVTQYVPVTKDINDIILPSQNIINASQASQAIEINDDTDVEASGEVDGIDEINNSTIPKSGLDISQMKPLIKISNKRTKNKFRILDGFQMKCPDGFIQQGTHCGRLIEISNSSFGKKDIEKFGNSSNKQDNNMIMLIILGLILMLAYRNQDLVRRYIKF